MNHNTNQESFTQEQIQAWADDAERGFDESQLSRPRPGRPSLGDGPGEIVSTRLDAPTLSALMDKAKLKGVHKKAEAVRLAIQDWIKHSA